MPLNRASRDRRQRPVIYLRLLISTPHGVGFGDPSAYCLATTKVIRLGVSGVGVDTLAYTRAELAPMQGEGHPFRSRRIR